VPRADVVAIELDRGRAEGLLSGKRATFNELRKHLGIRTALFAITLRWLQERIAAHLDVAPGIDMKAALIAASNHKKTVALIDRDIAVTMHRLRSSFGFRELLQLFRDVFRRRTIPLDPSDDVVLGVLAEMHERYPRLYTALVTERDEYMASALVNLATRYPGKRILAIVGKGHVPGMLTQIRYLNAAASVSAWTSTGKSA
jgi:pheromone shutdown protein TraB